jgi:hypothetical protein
MQCPSLASLPAPPPGRTGWPWTEESRRLPQPTGAASWPVITVVTPSFNQGRFIEETIRSILLQGYPNLEYFVLDGGSQDETVEVIRKYSPWIDFWVSEPDRGQSAAINRGLRMGSGSHATWINSDDLLCKDALFNHCSSHALDADAMYIGDCTTIDEAGRVLFRHRGRVRSFEDLVRFKSVWMAGGYICQQEVLFPLPLALQLGGLDENDHYSMDYELWGRLLLANARVEYTGIPFGVFRLHEAQKTQHAAKQIGASLDAAEALLARADSLSPAIKREVLAELRACRDEYPGQIWRRSGRLARIGLPPSIVTPIRSAKKAVERALGLAGSVK